MQLFEGFENEDIFHKLTHRLRQIHFHIQKEEIARFPEPQNI